MHQVLTATLMLIIIIVIAIDLNYNKLYKFSYGTWLRDCVTQWKVKVFMVLVKLRAFLWQSERISLEIFCVIRFSRRLTRHLVKSSPTCLSALYLLFIIECSKRHYHDATENKQGILIEITVMTFINYFIPFVVTLYF